MPWRGMVPPVGGGDLAAMAPTMAGAPAHRDEPAASRAAKSMPFVVHTEVHLDGRVLAHAVSERIVAGMNGPLAGAGGFDPRRSYTPVEG